MRGLACILSKAQTITVSLEGSRRLTRFRRGAFCQESPQHPSQATEKTFGVQVSDAETPPRPVLEARSWARAPPAEDAPGPPAAWAFLAPRQARRPLLLGVWLTRLLVKRGRWAGSRSRGPPRRVSRGRPALPHPSARVTTVRRSARRPPTGFRGLGLLPAGSDPGG